MAKYCGMIGYAICQEDPTRPGIFIDTCTERRYYGDYMKNTSSSWQSSGRVNDDLVISNQISILADAFAWKYFHCIKYAEFMGTLWKVTNVEVERPRLKLTMGGVYNGERYESGGESNGENQTSAPV